MATQVLNDVLDEIEICFNKISLFELELELSSVWFSSQLSALLCQETITLLNMDK